MLGFISVGDVYAASPGIDGVVLVDVSWVLHRSYYAFSTSAEVDGRVVNTSTMYGILSTLAVISRQYPAYLIVLCLDTPSERKQMFPEYKANRADHPEVYELLDPTLQLAALTDRVLFARKEGKEADDHMFNLAAKFSKDGYQVVIYCGDKDVYQSLQFKGVLVLNSLSKQNEDGVITRQLAIEKMDGVIPERLALYRAIIGDSSDNLKGYERFPHKLAAQVAEVFENPQALLECLDASARIVGITPARATRIKGLQANPFTLIRNYSLMKLSEFEGYCLHSLPKDAYPLIEKYRMLSYKMAIGYR